MAPKYKWGKQLLGRKRFQRRDFFKKIHLTEPIIKYYKIISVEMVLKKYEIEWENVGNPNAGYFMGLRLMTVVS